MNTRTRHLDHTEKTARIVSFFILLFFAVIFFIPLIWTLVSSFKVDTEVNTAGGFLLLPKTWTLSNYTEILSTSNRQTPVYLWLRNSIVVSGVHTALAVLIFTMSGYAYAKMKFKGRDFIFLTILFMSMFPQITNIIPLFRIMLTFGWLNGPLALIVPGLAGVMNIFLIRQFMYGIPDSVLESARLDGANEFAIFTRIIIPMSKPIMIVVGLFCFTANWNDFLWPSIAINNIDRLTLTPGLQLAKGAYGIYMAKMSAFAMIAILPMALLYLLTQKYFVNGISLQSGIKE